MTMYGKHSQAPIHYICQEIQSDVLYQLSQRFHQVGVNLQHRMLQEYVKETGICRLKEEFDDAIFRILDWIFFLECSRDSARFQ